MSELIKNAELTQWLNVRQSLLQVAQTTITRSGKTLDWVPIASQTKAAIATPPPASPSPAAQQDPQKPSKVVSFEDIGAVGPAGHVPILRPNLSKITGLPGLQQVMSKRFNTNRLTADKTPTDPNPAGYFHATSAQGAVKIYGCDAWLNVWGPEINVPSSPGDDHSISQTWLVNTQKGLLQTLEAGWTVDQGLNGDSAPHIFTFYTTNGYTAQGDNIGGYNRIHSGWVQVHGSIFPGIGLNGTSIRGGEQYDIGIKYQLFEGNWWFGINNSAGETGPWTWLGYYPAILFNGGLQEYSDWVSFGGEVYSALANPCGTTDQMGSGLHPAAGWTHAAYQKNLRNQSNTNGTMDNFNGGAETDTAAQNCPTNAYAVICSMNSGSSWGSYQFYGGPAGAQYNIGNNTTKDTPFVTPDGWVWFQGTDNKLWKIKNDGSGQAQIGNNTTNSTPFVTSDGWIWFQGTDNKLWKVRTDGTQQSQPRNNTTAAAPTVHGSWVYFRGTDNKLWRMMTDGSTQNQIGGNTTLSTPFVTPDGWVYFRGTDNKLWKVKNDGTSQSQIGGNTTKSTPYETADGWVWFQGTDNKLWKVKADGSQQSQPGNNTTASSPVVLGTLVFFRGTDNKLWQMKTDGSGQINLGGNTTSSTPAPTADSVYFQGTDNVLWRYLLD